MKDMKKGLIIAVVLSIVVPWILSFLFLTFLTDINWTQMPGGAGQILAILSFSAVAFEYNAPIFGYGYMIPLLIWILTGLFCGLFSKSALKGVLITLVGLLVHIILLVGLVSMNPAYIPSQFVTSENVGLLGGLSMDFFVTLGLFLCWYAFTLPGSLLGGMLGGIISRSPVAE
jgi:hypothetical protein